MLQPLADAETINGMMVTSWEYIDSRGQGIDYRQYGHAIARVHRLDPAAVAKYALLDWCGAAAWLQLDENLDRAARSKVVSGDDIALLRAETNALAGWQDAARGEPLVVCHGDVHPQNVLMRGEELVILDWDAICVGPVAWDHAALLTWAERWGGQPGDYSAFAAGYEADLHTSPLAQTLARVRLLAATINMIIAGNSSTHHAQEARLRMRYWHGEPDALAWTPQ